MGEPRGPDKPGSMKTASIPRFQGTHWKAFIDEYFPNSGLINQTPTLD
jgi:hypothetical protein